MMSLHRTYIQLMNCPEGLFGDRFSGLRSYYIKEIEMNNLFSNAYFGKPYKTRDGRKAIYIKSTDTYTSCHKLIVYNENVISYDIQGNSFYDHKKLDIISEWQEEIDETELNKLAKESELVKRVPVGHDLERKWAIDNFKAGYKQAIKDIYGSKRLNGQ